MAITFKTREQVASDIKERMLSRSTELSAFQEGDPLGHFVDDGLSAAVSDLHASSAELLQATALSEATGAYLERIGQDYGVSKLDESKAYGILSLIAPDSTAPSAYVDVAKGTRYWRIGVDGEPVEYETTQAPAELTILLTATGGAFDYIERTTSSWTADEYQYATVHIIGNTGAGQARQIAYNTSTRLYVADAWTTPPDGTSTFKIVTAKIPYDANDVVYDSDAPAGQRPGIDLLVRAIANGNEGNAPAGDIVHYSSLPSPVTKITNQEAFGNGRDREDDVSYARRVENARAANCGVSLDGIKARVLYFEDTAGENPLRSVNASSTSGSVLIYIDDGSEQVANDLISEVQDWVDGQWSDPSIYGVGAGGISRTVQAAQPLAVTVAVTITLAPGADPTSAKIAARNAIWNYVTVRNGVGGIDGKFYPRDMLAEIANRNILDIDMTYTIGGAAQATLDPYTLNDYDRPWMYEDPEITTV